MGACAESSGTSTKAASECRASRGGQGRFPPDRVSDHVWAHWDVLPTLAELAGAQAPPAIDGMSMARALRGQAQPAQPFLYWEFHERGFQQAVRMGRWKGLRLKARRRRSSCTTWKRILMSSVRSPQHHLDAAVLGIPLDIGTTYRPGTRFGPQAIRRISALYSPYSFEHGVDLREQLRLCDLGDVFAIPANIEKAFDQISRAVSHVFAAGAFPVMFGGDHSIGYPCVRGIAPARRRRHRHLPHRSPHRHPGKGHGRAHAHHALVPCHQHRERAAEEPRPVRHRRLAGAARRSRRSRERGTTVLTVTDTMRMGLDKAIDLALEVVTAGTKAVFLSLDIDSSTPASSPAPAGPSPAASSPAKPSTLLRPVAAEAVCALEVVEVSPPYDSPTSPPCSPSATVDVLATLVPTASSAAHKPHHRQADAY